MGDAVLRLSKALTICFVILSSLRATTASALVSEIWNYVKKYKLGVDYASATDDLELSYDTDRLAVQPASCRDTAKDPTRQRCGTAIQKDKNSDYGIVLQQVFRKKGLLYWDFDIGFSARYLQGQLSPSQSQKDGLPLKNVKYSLAALVAKPYVVFGITPQRWPDILLSLGPALQVAGGTVTINDKKKKVILGTGSGTSESGLLRGFTQLEIVFWRFGDGALSLFNARDFTGGVGTEFYPGEVDGMDNFRANFVRGVGGSTFGLGIKLILDWP